jgi:hypothetical protein
MALRLGTLSTCIIESYVYKYGEKGGTNLEDVSLKHETAKDREIRARLLSSSVVEPPF